MIILVILFSLLLFYCYQAIWNRREYGSDSPLGLLTKAARRLLNTILAVDDRCSFSPVEIVFEYFFSNSFANRVIFVFAFVLARALAHDRNISVGI